MDRPFDALIFGKAGTLGSILVQLKNMHTFDLATLLLVTDVGEELCWRQLLDVGDGVGRYRQQHSLSFK